MKYKIIEVKRRNWFMRLMSIYHFIALIEGEDGKRFTMKAWANSDDPSASTLLSSLRRDLRDRETSKKDRNKVEEEIAKITSNTEIDTSTEYI